MQPKPVEHISEPTDGFPRKRDRRLTCRLRRGRCSPCVFSRSAPGCQQDTEAVLEGDEEGVGA